MKSKESRMKIVEMSVNMRKIAMKLQIPRCSFSQNLLKFQEIVEMYQSGSGCPQKLQTQSVN